MTSLLNMPKDVMDMIIKDFECKSIFTLRKVCRCLRDYIDSAQPDIKLTGIQITFKYKQISLSYKIGQKVYSIEYEKQGENCNSTKEDTGLKLEVNQDFIELFFKNLKWILDFQKSNFEEIRLYLRHGEEITQEFRRSLESLKGILESRTTPIQVKKVYMQTKTQSEIMSILPYLDSKSLKTFHVFWLGFHHQLDWGSPQVIMELNEISGLEHWKTIEDMSFSNLRTTESLINFVHFPKFEVHAESISKEELVLLKMRFQKSTKMEKFVFRCYANSIDRYLVSLFGEPHDAEYQKKKWFFRIPNNNYRILELTNNWRTYEFQYIDQSKVPLGAVIRD